MRRLFLKATEGGRTILVALFTVCPVLEMRPPDGN
nr:MAG TPA: hypothetical protein [Caudoviricetes sp.]